MTCHVIPIMLTCLLKHSVIDLKIIIIIIEMKEKGTINANPVFKISDHFSSQSKVYAKPFASDFNRTT